MTLGKPPRLERVFQKYDPPLFFVTLCTAKRRPILATERVHRAVMEYGEHAAKTGIALGRYVIMPDHMHLFVCGGQDFDLGVWIRGLKRVVAAAVTAADPVEVAVPLPPETAAATTSSAERRAPVWQRGFFDHLIRSSESYAQKWEYVRENPVRAGLAASAVEWPFQGEIAVIHRV